MDICNLCQGFDIRALLLQSVAQKPRASGITNRNLVDAEDYRPAIPYFYKHQGSLVALKNSAENNCRLCGLFWRTWRKTLTKPDATDEWIDDTFRGQIYIGCSGWTTSKQGLPYITVIQRSFSGGDRTLSSFEAFAYRGEIPHDGDSLLGRAVYEDSASDECLSVLSGWLRTCLDKHELCSGWSKVEKALPTRVIDVGNDCCHPKLLVTNSRHGTWIALSYCWGGDSSFTLTQKTISDLSRAVPLNNFPATLQDAIVITRRLGIRYLWIDALCIQQDSAEDWANEAAKMGEVYSSAILTIAAANSPTTNAGIFSKRKFGIEHACLDWRSSVAVAISPNKVYLRPGSELWDNTLQGSPLMKRGWTLQEGLLAPRTIAYGLQQMIWECSQYQADESGRITVPTQDYRGKGFIQYMIRRENEPTRTQHQKVLKLLSLGYPKPDRWWTQFSARDPYDKWYDIVSQFTGRSLTKYTDSLPALSGLAREFARSTNDTYCAGLWKKDIICGLIWNRTPAWSKDGTTRYDLTKSSEYIAPSWSWASMLGKQANLGNWKTREALSKSSLDIAAVLDIQLEPKNADAFGQLKEGTMILKARFCLVENVQKIMQEGTEFHPPSSATASENGGKIGSYKSPFQQEVFTTLRNVSATEYEFSQKHVSTSDQQFGVIEIVRWAKSPDGGTPGMDFLIVESTGRPDNSFRRIGQFGIRNLPVPNREDVGESMYFGTVAMNDAWEEVVNGKWKRRVIKLV